MNRKWSLENDDAGDAYAWAQPCDNWLIRDMDTDNADIVAVIPKTGDEDYDNDVTYRNGKLIESAPDMLEALASIVEDLDDICPVDAEDAQAFIEAVDWKAVRELIAKANGESQ